MNYDRELYMRRQEQDHDLLRMRTNPRPFTPRQAQYRGCPRGEHRYETGKRTCPDCGEEL